MKSKLNIWSQTFQSLRAEISGVPSRAKTRGLSETAEGAWLFRTVYVHLRASLTPCALAFLRYLYWVNQGQRGVRTIETAGMDGSDRKVLAVVNTEEPVGLTLDHMTGRLYWISKYKEVL